MAFSNPRQNVAQMAIDPGMHVADLGSGSGFYSFALAETVGDAGRVYAVDIQRELLSRLKNEARKRGLDNIEIIWADLEKNLGTGLKAGSMDVVLISNTLFQVKNKKAFLEEAKRLLKPLGRFILIDFSDSFGGLGPQQEYIVNEEEARRLAKEVGFVFSNTIRAGEHHYGLIFKTS